MNSWEDRYVRELVDEFDRLGRIPSEDVAAARSALDEDRYREALDILLKEMRDGREELQDGRERIRDGDEERRDGTGNSNGSGREATGVSGGQVDRNRTDEPSGNGPIGDGGPVRPTRMDD